MNEAVSAAGKDPDPLLEHTSSRIMSNNDDSLGVLCLRSCVCVCARKCICL